MGITGTPPGVQIPIPQKSKHYLLTEENTVTFRGPVYSGSVTDFGERLLNLSYSLREGDTINIVLDSPGGSIYAGLNLISLIESVPQKVNCIAIFAASMAHSILQACPGKRYIASNNGVVMIHRARGMFSGQFNDGEVESQLKTWKQIVMTMEKNNAARMSYSYDDYKARAKDEWWCSGYKCVKERFVDGLANIRCGKNLHRVKVKVNKHYYYSACPLISGYMKYGSY